MTPGIYYDLSLADYLGEQEHLSSTLLRQARRSLAAFDCYRQGMLRAKGPQLDFGNAFELALMDEKAFQEQVAVLPDTHWVEAARSAKPNLKNPRASKAYKEQQEAFMAQNSHKYLIADKGEHSLETIKRMVASCKEDTTIEKLLTGVNYQVSLFWADETGLRCKTRPDVCKPSKGMLLDIKTALSGSPKAFSQSLVKFDYPLQACMQIEGAISCGLMEQVKNYFWLVVEKQPPHSATLYEFDSQDIHACQQEYRLLKEQVKAALATNHYPGYSARADNRFGILTAPLPAYYLHANA